MKKNTALMVITILATLWGIYTPSVVNAQTFNSPVEYMEYINNEYHQITNAQWEYTKAIAHNRNAKKVEKRRQELLQTIKGAQKKVFQMPGYEGDVEFKNFVGKHLNINYSIVNDDYAKIVDMEAVAEQSYDLMEAYLLAKKIANEKLANAAKAMHDKMEVFAKKNNIRLVETESKLAEKMEIAGKAFSYHNDMYLIFFKSYMQESSFLEALNKQDVNAMEQAKNALFKYTKEGLGNAAKMAKYNGDPALYNACIKMLGFYQEEAETQMPILIDYSLKKENFDKLKTTIDKTPASKRTNEDINKFNKAVADINAATNAYNNANNAMNKKRTELINMWNKAAANFLNKHVP